MVMNQISPWRWNGTEILSLDDLVASFDLKRVNTTAARFDLEKLRWVNGEWMKRLSDARLREAFESWLSVVESPLARLADVQKAELLSLYRARAATFLDLETASAFFLRRPATYDAKALKKWLGPEGREALASVRTALVAVAWNVTAIGEALAGAATQHGGALGAVAQPLRVALTGAAVSPEIERTVAFFDRAEVLARIDVAMALPL